jgi:hypothetical protein
MYYSIHNEDGFTVRGWAARFTAPALINGYIHQNRAFLHLSQSLAINQHRGLAARNKYSADYKIGRRGVSLNSMGITIDCGDIRRHHLIQVSESF